jgi:hypothetical protein
MLSPLCPLNSRTLSSGLAQRTLKNLDFIIKNASSTEVHPVTQVVNSLLGLLVFPVEKEAKFHAALPQVKFNNPSDLLGIRGALIQCLPVASLQVTKFDRCKSLSEFFKKVRNAISHKHLEFCGPDPDSRILADVNITLRDCKSQGKVNLADHSIGKLP